MMGSLRSNFLAGRAEFAVFSVVVLIGVALLSAALALIASDRASFHSLVVISGVFYASVIAFEWKRNGDPLTATGVIAMAAFLLFFVRPWTVAVSGVTSAGAKADSRIVTAYMEQMGTRSMGQALIFFGVIFGVYYFVLTGRRSSVSVPIGIGVVAEEYSVSRARAVLIFFTLVGILCSAYLIFSSGGFSSYFAGISNRSSFLSGRSFLVLSYVPLLLALVTYILVRRRRGILRIVDIPTAMAVATVVVVTFISGGRGHMILGCFLPLLIVKQVGPRPLRGRSLGLALLAVAATAISYGILVRDSVFTDGSAAEELRESPVRTILERITSGSELRPFDSLMRLNEVSEFNSFDFQSGNTYLATLAWFVPRGLWSDKPGGGGNTWFTSNFVPRYYGVDRIETSLSAVGEAFANFSWLGLILAGILLAVLAFTLARDGFHSGGMLRSVLVVTATPLMFSLVRGDAYQNVSMLVAQLGFMLGLLHFLREPRQGVIVERRSSAVGV